MPLALPAEPETAASPPLTSPSPLVTATLPAATLFPTRLPNWISAGHEAALPVLLAAISGGGFMSLLALHVASRADLLRRVQKLKDHLKARRRETADLLDTIPVPIIVANEQGQILHLNGATTILLTRDPPTADVARLVALMRANAHGSQEKPGGLTVEWANGVEWRYSMTRAHIAPFGGWVELYAIHPGPAAQDTTTRPIHAYRLALLGELASTIVHELNHLLAIIQVTAANGFVQAQPLPGSERVAEKFMRIQTQVERSKRIIESVSRLVKIRSVDQGCFNIADSLAITLQLARPQFHAAGITLHVEITLPDGELARGDPTLFEIAILNVLINASKAFRQARPNRAQPWVTVKAYRSGTNCIVRIADNAGGIAPDILPHIFDAFVSSPGPESGTGLGLSIARRAIESMSGSIEAVNTGTGANFSIVLPIFLPKPTPCAPTSS
ncbi:MAG TPA: ATP-binding protein [Candidatus Saccharimonadales bacterium]|nr:ATP-binding protein [Candidatus Saccharimonadales bacterium]